MHTLGETLIVLLNIKELRVYMIKLFAKRYFMWLSLISVLVLCVPNAQSNDRELYRNALKSYEWLLQNLLRQNLVDYSYLKKNQSILNHYVYVVGRTSYDDLQQAEQLAFVINAYNAFVLRLVLDYWPHIRSMNDIPDFPLPRRWKDQRWMFDGKRVSLNDLKHNYLRPLKNPIAYFSLFCGAASCPDLQPTLYRAAIIDKQLDESVKIFLSKKKGLQWRMSDPLVRKPKPMVFVSELFRKDEDVFIANGYTILAFVEEFAPQGFKAFLNSHRDQVELKYLSFDWDVNAIR